jgi:uncharacterized protein YukJ
MTHARTKPASQQRIYGVLVGTIHDGQEDPAGHSPHYEIWVEADQSYRIAVNVRSVDGSDVLAHYDRNFTNPTKLGLVKRMNNTPSPLMRLSSAKLPLLPCII